MYCDLRSGDAVVFELEQDEGGSGDASDGRGVESDPAQGPEGDLQQGVGPLGDSVHTPDHGVERLVGFGEFTALGLLDRVAKAVCDVLIAEVGQGGDAQGGGEPVEGVDQAVGTGAGGVVLAARPDRGDPQRPAVRCRDDLYVPSVVLVFPRPPQVRSVGAGGSHAVGADHGAVQVEVGVPRHRRTLQRGGQIGRVVSQHGKSLVQVAVGGGGRDAVVPGELGDPGAVDEPAQHQHRLPEDAQRTGAPASAEPLAMGAQQLCEMLGGRPADIEHSGIGDTGRHAEPLVVRNVIFADLFLPGAPSLSVARSPPRRPRRDHVPQPSRCREDLNALEPQLKRDHQVLIKRLDMQREAAERADAAAAAAAEREAQERQEQRKHSRHMAGLLVGAVVAVAMLGAGVYVAQDAWWLATLLCGPSLLALAKIFVLRRSDPDDMKFVSNTARSSTNSAPQAQPPVP